MSERAKMWGWVAWLFIGLIALIWLIAKVVVDISG